MYFGLLSCVTAEHVASPEPRLAQTRPEHLCAGETSPVAAPGLCGCGLPPADIARSNLGRFQIRLHDNETSTALLLETAAPAPSGVPIAANLNPGHTRGTRAACMGCCVCMLLGRARAPLQLCSSSARYTATRLYTRTRAIRVETREDGALRRPRLRRVSSWIRARPFSPGRHPSAFS